MIDKENAIKEILSFLENKNKKILLVRGYDNSAKIRVVLSCLNREFSKGIIRTSSMADISDHINRAFNNRLLPNTVKSTTTYKIGNMNVNFNSYVTHTRENPRGNESTFTVYFPVQTVLGDKIRYKKFISDLEDCKSKKIVLVTTNDWSIGKWDIEEHMDQVYFYSVENDNPQIMRNLRNNGAI